ncbi:MAG: hypothetical protein JWR69_2341 [Pedosphaera sp.]|nr:hypothetical protein [Pedosphaera sp.]
MIGASIITGFLLFMSGTSLVSVKHSDGHAAANGSFMWTSVSIGFHWSTFALLAAGGAGLLLLLLPRHKKSNV